MVAGCSAVVYKHHLATLFECDLLLLLVFLDDYGATWGSVDEVGRNVGLEPEHRTKTYVSLELRWGGWYPCLKLDLLRPYRLIIRECLDHCLFLAHI